MENQKITTKMIEGATYKDLWKQGTYLCFEVKMPDNGERVDLLSYDTKGNWRFYEIKISKSDFYSRCKHTFLGHYNYYILTDELYEKIKSDIPFHIGVYIFKKNHIYSVVRAKKQELKVNHDKLMFSFMQSLSREYQKYRRFLSKN